MKTAHIVKVSLLSDLKVFPGDDDNIVITTGMMNIGDGKGALYYWDSASVEAEDTVAYNVVTVTGTSTGRWKKVFTRKIILPHGTLFINNGKREFFCSTVTDANSEALINLTMDNTTNGTAIFASVLFDDSKANINVSSVNDMVSSCRKLLSANMKQLTHIFGRGNSSLVSLLGVNVLGLRGAAAGTSVTFKVEGE